MRIAILSDIHGNVTAFHAVLSDLRQMSPDLTLHGGDLADMGSSPVEIVDHIRDLRWPGVAGNGEEALAMPQTLEDFAAKSSAPPHLWAAIREMMAAGRSKLGDERLAWLRGLPPTHIQRDVALLHASPGDAWRAPSASASDVELERVFGSLAASAAVYGHIHVPLSRTVYSPNRSPLLVANSGSVGLPYDGDHRASYLLIDGANASIRRVPYDIDKEIKNLSASGLPHSDWVARILRSAAPQLP